MGIHLVLRSRRVCPFHLVPCSGRMKLALYLAWVSFRPMFWTDETLYLAWVSSRPMFWTDEPQFNFQVRFHLVPCSGRMYLFIFPLEKDLWTIYPCVQGFYSSMLTFFLWINLNEHIRIPIIYLKTIYIYLKIQTYVNIRPQAWHMLIS